MTNTSSGTVRIAQISRGPSTAPWVRTTPPLPSSWCSPCPAMCTMRRGSSSSALTTASASGLISGAAPSARATVCASSRAAGSSAYRVVSHCGSPITSTLPSRPVPTGRSRKSSVRSLRITFVRTAHGASSLTRPSSSDPASSSSHGKRAAALSSCSTTAVDPARKGSISTGTSSWNRLRRTFGSVLAASAPMRTISSTSFGCVAWPRTSVRARCVSSVNSITGWWFGPRRCTALMKS